MAASSSRTGNFLASTQRVSGRQTYRTSGKKAIAEPIHVGNFVVILIITICKKILLIDTSVKIGVYLIGVMLGSVLCDAIDLPKSFFSSKGNFLNQYFVKLGWGWTVIPLTAFVFMTSFVHSCGNMATVKRNLCRMAMATFWWYTCTHGMNYIEFFTGECTDSSYLDKRSCVKAQKAWLGFDMSGHVFLLMHCLLTISEEVKCFKDWSKVKGILDQEDVREMKKLSGKEVSQGQFYYKQLTPFIKMVILLLTMISVLWEFMLIITTVYRFHTMAQKVSAAFLAVICWFVSYQVFYQAQGVWTPGLPGESPLQYTKVKSSRRGFGHF